MVLWKALLLVADYHAWHSYFTSISFCWRSLFDFLHFRPAWKKAASIGQVRSLCTRLQGWPVLAFCIPQDWTENLMVSSPTLQPLNHVVDQISCQNVSIYAQSILNYQGNSKIQKSKICIDQELNWGSSGCLCHHMTQTTRPKIHIQEQLIWKFKLEQNSSWSVSFSPIKIYLAPGCPHFL